MGLVSLLSCAEPSGLPSAPPAAAELLRTCPAGDRLWREAITRAEEPTALAMIEGLAREVSAKYPERWEPRWAAAEALYRQSKATDSERDFEHSYELAGRADDPVGVACTANRLGTIARVRGDSAAARLRFAEALAAARRAKRIDLEAYVQNNLAAVHKDAGRLGEAAEALDAAIALLHKQGLTQAEHEARYNRGVLLRQMGDLRGARAALEAAHRIAREGGDERVASLSSIVMGNLLLSIGAVDESEAWFERVSDSSPQSSAYRDLGLGLIALERRAYPAAIASIDRSAATARNNGLVIDALLAEARGGEVLVAQGHVEAARRRLRGVVAEAEASDSRVYALWLAQWQLALADEAAGDRTSAIDHLRRAVAVIESQGVELRSTIEGLHFLLERVDPYADLAAILSQGGGQVDEILEVHFRGHARALRRTTVPGLDDERAPTLRSIQESLRPDEILLDYLIGRRRGAVLAITRSEAVARLVPGIDELQEPVRSWRDALERPLRGNVAARLDPLRDLERSVESGRELTRALIEPIEALLRERRRIRFVVDRELATIPFAALPLAERHDSGRVAFLGERFEVSNLPFASAVKRSPIAGGRVLLLGNPTADPDGRFPALPGARAEIDGIESAWAGAECRRVEGQALAIDTVTNEVAAANGPVHFATHAVASTNDPRICAIVLSNGARLGFDRIAELPLRAPLVVLSSCRSGEGEAIPGQGLVGLGWAFLRAGAGGVVASLWTVDDRSTAETMIAFHRSLANGEEVPAALAAAQQLIRARYPHPAWWAPFVSYEQPAR